MIIPNENIVEIISCSKELAHRIDHSNPKYFILCPRRLQPTHDDCAVRIQWSGSKPFDILTVYLKVFLKVPFEKVSRGQQKHDLGTY